MTLMSRAAVETLIIAGFLTGAACAPSPTPGPTASLSPSQIATAAGSAETATPAPSAARAADSPTRTETATPKSIQPLATQAGAPPGWQADWDKTVALAKKEARVIVVGSLGDGPLSAAMAFQKAYPDIQLEFTGAVTRRYALELLAERRGGRYLVDVLMGAATEVYGGLLPGGAFDPLRPALLLPEVLDESKWHGGFDDGWGDRERKYVYMPVGFVVPSVWVNRDMVPESELNSLGQLLDPQWKGKIVALDPRLGGPGLGSLQALLIGKGEDFVRRLLAQDLTLVNETRQAEEAIVRGRYPIGIGIGIGRLSEFTPERLGKSVKPLAPDELGGSAMGAGGGSVMLVNRAPHPNAAKVYINWLLSQQGQNAWVQATGYNSRRIDVRGPPDRAPKAGIKYVRPAKEEADPYRGRATAIAKEVIK